MTLLTRRTALFGLAAGLAGAQGVRRYVLEERTAPRYEPYQGSGSCREVWRSGAVLVVEDNRSDEPLIRRIGRDGELERFRFSVPGWRMLILRGIAEAADGTVVVLGKAVRGDNDFPSFMALIRPDRQGQSVKDLSPYEPQAVTVAPDGTIWTAGQVRDGDSIGQENVLRRFDAKGEVVGSRKIPVNRVWQSRVKGYKWRLRDGTGGSLLTASKDKVGWLTYESVYLEFTFEGEDAGRWETPLDRGSSGHAALRADGEIVVGSVIRGKQGLWRLDRVQGRWEPVRAELPREMDWAWPLGFDGDTLILGDNTGMVGRFVEERTR